MKMVGVNTILKSHTSSHRVTGEPMLEGTSEDHLTQAFVKSLLVAIQKPIWPWSWATGSQWSCLSRAWTRWSPGVPANFSCSVMPWLGLLQ